MPDLKTVNFILRQTLRAEAGPHRCSRRSQSASVGIAPLGCREGASFRRRKIQSQPAFTQDDAAVGSVKSGRPDIDPQAVFAGLAVVSLEQKRVLAVFPSGPRCLRTGGAVIHRTANPSPRLRLSAGRNRAAPSVVAPYGIP